MYQDFKNPNLNQPIYYRGIMSVYENEEWIVVSIADKAVRLMQLKTNTTLDLGRSGKVPSDMLIGQIRTRLSFWVENGSIRAMTSAESKSTEIVNNDDEDDECQRDNRNVVDDNTSQKLSTAEIEQLKESGLTQGDLVDVVVRGSMTFAGKNTFSQQKYVQRKRRKYLQYFHMEPITTRSLMGFHTQRDPRRILDLRLDSLANIMTLANIQPGLSQSVLIWDDSLGLVTGAILTKIGHVNDDLTPLQYTGPNPESSTYTDQVDDPISAKKYNIQKDQNTRCEATVVNVHSEPQMQVPNIIHWNLSADIRAQLHSAHIKMIDPELQEYTAKVDTDPSKFPPPIDADQERIRLSRYLDRRNRRQRVTNLFKERQFDSLVIITSNTDVLALLTRLVPFLKSSGKLVVYAQSRELVFESYFHLRRSKEQWVDVNAQDSWCRPYQTATGRVHPAMNCDGGTGTIISATKVCN